jgi:hypothetical protein
MSALPRAHRAAARTCPLRGDASRRAALGCRPDPPRTPRLNLKPMRLSRDRAPKSHKGL